MESKKKILALAFMLIILSTTFAMLPTIGNPELLGPGMDAYYAVIIPSPDAQLAKLRADEIQAADVPYYEEIQKLRSEGFFVNGPVLSSAFEYYDINVGGYKYYPTTHGFPLNSTRFRRAIAYLTNTEQLIATDPLIKGFGIRNYAWAGRLLGPWCNTRPEGDPLAVEKFIYSPQNAIHEMFLGEFVPISKTTGNPMTEDQAKSNPGDIHHWEYRPSGTPIGPVGPIRTIEMYGCTSWPYYISMADAWVAGLEGIGIHTTKFYATWATVWPKISRGDIDIGPFGTAWSRPDPYIIDLYFASWYQPKLPSNSPCCNWRFIEDPEIDEWIRTYGSTLNETLAVECAHKVQQKVAREAYMPAAFTWISYSAYNPSLMGIMRSIYGIDRSLGYFQAQWWDPVQKEAHNNAIKVAWYEEPEDLNPAVQVGVTASWLIGALVDGYGGGFGLTVLDPTPWSPTYLSYQNHKPWIAWKWTVDTWEVSPGVTGTKITYYLRKDVYWHDGVKFTADDVKFCLEYLRDHGHAAGQSRFTTGYLDHVDVVDADGDGWKEAVVYHKRTSLFTLTYTSFWAAELPKHIWEGVTVPEAVTPWAEDNPNPAAAAIGLTKLIGTGPLVYHKGDWVEGQYIRFRANRPPNVLGPGHFRSAEVSIADINFDFGVNVLDAIPITRYFGVKQGDPQYLIHYDINCNGKVDIYDVGLLLAHYGQIW